MIQPIVSSLEPITLVGAGSATEADLLAARALAPGVVAADGGAALALSGGIMPDAVIGDFDSLSKGLRGDIPQDRLHHVGEQDSTDFEKCMARISAPLVVGVGFTGGRIDHELAVFHGLLRFAHRPCVLIAASEIILLCPPELRIDLPQNATVSLFPLVPTTGRSTGLVWPIDGLNMAPGAQIGTSNKAIGGPVHLEMDAPGMLLFVPRAALEPVMSAVVRSVQEPGPWPAP